MIALFLLSVYATIKIAYQTDRGLLYLNSNLMLTPELQASLKMKKIEILGQEDGKVILVGGDNRVLEVGDNGVLRRTEFLDDAHKIKNITKLSSVTLSPNDVNRVGFILALVDDKGYKILPASGKCLFMNKNKELVVGTSSQCKLESSHFKLIITQEDIPFVPRNEEEGKDPEAMSHTGGNGIRKDGYTDSRHNVAVHGMLPTHIVRSSGREGGMHTREYSEDEGYGSDDRAEPPNEVGNPKKKYMQKKGFSAIRSKQNQKSSHPKPSESNSTPEYERYESDTNNEDSVKQLRSETHEHRHGEGHQHGHKSPVSIHYYFPVSPPKGAQQPYQNPGAISTQSSPQNSTQPYTGQVPPSPLNQPYIGQVPPAPPMPPSPLNQPYTGQVPPAPPMPPSPLNQPYIGLALPFSDPNASFYPQNSTQPYTGQVPPAPPMPPSPLNQPYTGQVPSAPPMPFFPLNQGYTTNPFVSEPVPFIPQNSTQPLFEESSTMDPPDKTPRERIMKGLKKLMRKRF